MKKRVIIGAVLHNDAAAIANFLQSLSRIECSEYKLGFAFIAARLSPLCQYIVRMFLHANPGFVEAHYVQKEQLQAAPHQHRGNWHFALCRNRLIQEAIQSKADALLLLDSDNLIEPTTLDELLSRDVAWIDKLVFKEGTPLASPTIAQEFSDVDPKIFDDHELCLIACAGSCMLLQKEALGPILRYQYFASLGLPHPDQHLANRALLTELKRHLDTRNPLYKNKIPQPKEGSLAWLTEGASKLLSYTPQSTGLEGLSYLCKDLQDQRTADAPQLAADVKAAQVHSRVYIVNIEQSAETEDDYTLWAIQELQAGEITEHNIVIIHLMTTEEDGRRCIKGIDLSSLLEAELPKIQPSKRQRYAIPPLQSTFQNATSDEDAQKVDSRQAKQLLNAVKGLQIYRLPI